MVTLLRMQLRFAEHWVPLATYLCEKVTRNKTNKDWLTFFRPQG